MLSFFSIFGIQNNKSLEAASEKSVVNCFHFSVSLGYKTTKERLSKKPTPLWIAFIFQYLWDTKQHWDKREKGFSGCELLSFFSIFGIQNNQVLQKQNSNYVVNCFHFSVSLGYKTTQKLLGHSQIKLWIAFIFQYLWDTKQRLLSVGFLFHCCELLSFFSIFGIQNNKTKILKISSTVVNCFHFSVSLGYKTTLIICIVKYR